MISNNKSFIRGILCASFTWAVSIYLYWILTTSSDESLNTIPNENLLSRFQRIPSHIIKGNIDSLEESVKYKNKDKSNHKSGNSIISSNKKYTQEKTYEKSQGLSSWSKDNLKKKYFKTKEKHTNISNKTQIDITRKKSDSFDIDGEIGFIKTPEDRRIRDEGYKIYAFNILASQRIGDSRIIPDTRHQLCTSQVFPDNLPDVSIIICFYNEHFHTLTRSVQSILDRTPQHLLKEIILVDDYSDVTSLHSDVETYVSNLSDLLIKRSITNNIDSEFKDHKIVQVRLLKTNHREGLIRARLYGAENSTGKVMVFLDSHIEVNQDWLQPLLSRLSENVTLENPWSNRVVMPIIDVINADTFQYKASPLVRGGFNWGLHFKWDSLPKDTLKNNEDFVKPFKSPTMAGGLFAIYRKYFDMMGKYDAGMDTWGGENLEMSFRIWMCGGSLEIIPCSRVGHVFRKRRPYGSPEGGDSMLHNSLRLAHVWMDSYIDNYIKKIPNAALENYGDISERIALRKSLNCKSFQWYLENVYPELVLDSDSENEVKQKMNALSDSQKNNFQPWHSRKRNYVDSYQLRLTNTTLCVQAAKNIKTKGGTMILAICSKSLNQMWYETELKELVMGKMLCLEAPLSGDGQPTISKCHEMAGTQEWHHSKDGAVIYNLASGTCLGVDEKLHGSPVVMKICVNNNLILWDFIRS